MANDSLVLHLCKLTQLDIDAVATYEQALKHIESPEIHTQISSFRDDHLRHITRLSAEIKKLGGNPPEHSKDIKGYMLEGFTALRSLTGTIGALKAMKTNERLTNAVYEDALSWEMDDECRKIIEENYQDEKRHLEYIQNNLDQKT